MCYIGCLASPVTHHLLRTLVEAGYIQAKCAHHSFKTPLLPEDGVDDCGVLRDVRTVETVITRPELSVSDSKEHTQAMQTYAVMYDQGFACFCASMKGIK